MSSKNDVTGDSLVTKASSEAYRANWDLIFGKPKVEDKKPAEDPPCDQPAKNTSQ